MVHIQVWLQLYHRSCTPAHACTCTYTTINTISVIRMYKRKYRSEQNKRFQNCNQHPYVGLQTLTTHSFPSNCVCSSSWMKGKPKLSYRSENLPPRRKPIPKDAIFLIISVRYTENFTGTSWILSDFTIFHANHTGLQDELLLLHKTLIAGTTSMIV